jgi:hypothetical protein
VVSGWRRLAADSSGWVGTGGSSRSGSTGIEIGSF